MSRVGSRLLRSVREARAYARGETTEGFAVHVPEEVDVKAIRAKTGLSQEAFALRYGFSPDQCGTGSSTGASPRRRPASYCW